MRFRRLRFGHSRPSYIKIQETKVWDFAIVGVCCMVEVKGRVTGVVLRLAGSCMRGLKMWENWWKNLDRQPTCASSPPHGRRWNRSRGSRSGPKMCHRKRGGGPTWVFLFAHVIRVNEKKILQKFVENWTIGTQTDNLGNKEDLTISATSFLTRVFLLCCLWNTYI